jgi:hypothetical protein
MIPVDFATAAIVVYAIGIPIATGIFDSDGSDIGNSLGAAFFWPLFVFVALPLYGLYCLGRWIVKDY